MSSTRQDYLNAKAAADAAWKALRATPEQKTWEDACSRLEAIRDDLGDIEICENCGEPIFEGDVRTCDHENGISLCKDCSPTWQDFSDRPEDFYDASKVDPADGGPLYHTKETARPLIEAHLASGGSLSDSMAH